MDSSPELVDLFTAYTRDAQGIGPLLSQVKHRSLVEDPLIVATGFDVALYPGGGRPPMVDGFRLSVRGFKELSAVSHLGPAVASLVSIAHHTGDDSWHHQAVRLLAATERARAANSPRLWRDVIAVEAFRGREFAIAGMCDYACAATEEYLRRALTTPGYLSAETLRADFLNRDKGKDGTGLINDMMVATFFLAGLDTSFRLIRWFREQQIDWERAMVVVAGRQGRPTAGVTWNTSSVATMLLGASEYRLPLERMYIAPHAPVFATPKDGDLSEVVALEEPLRTLWAGMRGMQELGEIMFAGYPRYSPDAQQFPDVCDPRVTEVGEMPVIHGPDDLRAMVTRLRVVLEDARQLLSGCVTDYAVAQLVKQDNDPTAVTVPGLDNVRYPRLP
ncbi:DUF5624 domain-containing protein [Kutzneria sp. NPDC052558]|uniref:DUF5624 domain-containing protein n=1 Tax=Kutzneria sp. NPDC052558 TaxID=3364121 RepID=UPI0037C634D6